MAGLNHSYTLNTLEWAPLTELLNTAHKLLTHKAKQSILEKATQTELLLVEEGPVAHPLTRQVQELFKISSLTLVVAVFQ